MKDPHHRRDRENGVLSETFVRRVREIFQAGYPVLATIPLRGGGEFLEEIRRQRDVITFIVNIENRGHSRAIGRDVVRAPNDCRSTHPKVIFTKLSLRKEYPIPNQSLWPNCDRKVSWGKSPRPVDLDQGIGYIILRQR